MIRSSEFPVKRLKVFFYPPTQNEVRIMEGSEDRTSVIDTVLLFPISN